MTGERNTIPFVSRNQPNLSPEDPKLRLVRQIAKIDCGAIPFSMLEVKVRDDGRPYSVVIKMTYMIDSEGNIS